MLISSNANKWDINIPDDVQFDADTLRVKFPTYGDEPPVRVTIERNPEALQSLRFQCNACKNACDHVGAVFSMVNSSASAAPPDALVSSLRSGLEAFVEGGDKPRLTITLPDRATLDQLSLSLARLLSAVAQPMAVKSSTGTGG